MSGRRDIRHDRPALELKVATRRLIADVGGTDGAAATVGTRQQRISDCQNRSTADFLRLDEIGALEDVSPEPHITRALARRQGYELLPIPVAPALGAEWLDALRQATKEFGDVSQALLASLTDPASPGIVSAKNIDELEIDRELGEAFAALAQIRALVDRARDC